MMRKAMLTLALVCTLAMTTSVRAESTAAAEKQCEGSCCPISAAMANLPKITYQVGSEETCCSKTAAKLAEKSAAEVTYLVGKEKFDAEPAAMVALADVTEKFVADFAKPHTCDVSGKTTVAGKEHCCQVMAGQTAKLVQAAMKKVEMTYKVGDKACHCPVEAKTLAKTSGEKTLFVVAGEETCCNVSARVKLAQAKYKAAVQALVAAEKTDEAAKL